MFEGAPNKTEIPRELGKIVDIAPISQESRSVWLMLVEDCRLFRFDARNGKAVAVGASNVPAEVPGTPFGGHTLGRRLYASQNGEFAAVENDY